MTDDGKNDIPVGEKDRKGGVAESQAKDSRDTIGDKKKKKEWNLKFWTWFKKKPSEENNEEDEDNENLDIKKKPSKMIIIIPALIILTIGYYFFKDETDEVITNAFENIKSGNGIFDFGDSGLPGDATDDIDKNILPIASPSIDKNILPIALPSIANINDSHTVIKGDNLWNIAKSGLGNNLENLSPEQQNRAIALAVQEIINDTKDTIPGLTTNPNLITLGMELDTLDANEIKVIIAKSATKITDNDIPWLKISNQTANDIDPPL